MEEIKDFRISISEMWSCPYLTACPRDGRILWDPCWYSSETKTYHSFMCLDPPEERKAIIIQPVDIHNGCFWTENRIVGKEDDMVFLLIEILYKHLSFPELYKNVIGLTNKLVNAVDGLRSLIYFEKLLKDGVLKDLDRPRFEELVFENTLVNVRSSYDELVQIMDFVFKGVRPPIFHKSGRSFTTIAQKLKDDISKKPEGMPDFVAEFYHRHSNNFLWLRGFRDDIVHRGLETPSVFITKEGFAIFRKFPHVSKLPIWTAQNTEGDNLASAKSILAYVIKNLTDCFEDFGVMIQRMNLPDSISTTHHVVLRVPGLRILNKLDSFISNWDGV